tara:strand:- start:33 stop:1082 length:1050 start_codon:yes stop_codon:yes gene_type:complete
MAYITFQPSDYFNTVLWAGNGSAGRNITGVGFQPDWVWVKNRSRSSNHTVVDVLRGSGSYPMSTSSTSQQDSGDTNQVSALISDGFTIGSSTNTNANGENLVGWSWRAGGSGSSNSDGSITSTVSANTTAGFSIVKWTGTEAAATVGHGLGAVPQVILVKAYDDSGGTDWIMYNENLGNTKNIRINTTDAQDTNNNAWNATTPTSSVFSVGNFNDTNRSNGNIVAYCFTEKKGFSKFGIYTGNGVADGAFVYTGFKPAFLFVKEVSQSGESWPVYDRVRSVANVTDEVIFANANQQEEANQSSKGIDFLSNGFKIRSTDAVLNDGEQYIYWAFAEEPLVASNGDPATAR